MILTLVIYTCCVCKGILVLLYKCFCCCCKKDADPDKLAEQGALGTLLAAPRPPRSTPPPPCAAAKFKEPTRLCKVITHFVCGALVVAGVATAFTANAEARGGVDNTFTTLNDFADHLTSNLVKVENTFEAVFANISALSNDTSSTNMTEQIDQFSDLATSIDDLSDSLNNERGSVDSANECAPRHLLVVFRPIADAPPSPRPGPARSPCTPSLPWRSSSCSAPSSAPSAATPAPRGSSAAWPSYRCSSSGPPRRPTGPRRSSRPMLTPVPARSVVMAINMVFAGVIADVCPAMEDIAIDNVGSTLEPDVRCGPMPPCPLLRKPALVALHAATLS